jgi:hypothetical protein
MASQAVVDLWAIFGALALSLVVAVVTAFVDSWSATKAHPVHTGHLIVVALIVFALTLVALFVFSWLVVAPVRDRAHPRERLGAPQNGAVEALRADCREFADKLRAIPKRAVIAVKEKWAINAETAEMKLYLEQELTPALRLIDRAIELGAATREDREAISNPSNVADVAALFGRLADADEPIAPRTASQVIAAQLQVGNSILSGWPQPNAPQAVLATGPPPPADLTAVQQAMKVQWWEPQAYDLLGKYTPQWREHFRLEANLGPEWFSAYEGEPAERSLLRRRVFRLAEIQDKRNRAANGE